MSGRETVGKIKSFKPNKKAALVDLNETIIEQIIPVSDNEIELTFKIMEKGSMHSVGRSLLIGEKNPNSTCCYAMVKGAGRVLLIGKSYKDESIRFFKSSNVTSTFILAPPTIIVYPQLLEVYYLQ